MEQLMQQEAAISVLPITLLSTEHILWLTVSTGHQTAVFHMHPPVLMVSNLAKRLSLFSSHKLKGNFNCSRPPQIELALLPS